MIVVLMFNIPPELKKEIRSRDLQGSDYTDYVNELAQNHGEQQGVWHFQKATERQIVHALGVVFGQMEGGKT